MKCWKTSNQTSRVQPENCGKIAAVEALDTHRDWNTKRKKQPELTNFFLSMSKSVPIWLAVSVRLLNYA